MLTWCITGIKNNRIFAQAQVMEPIKFNHTVYTLTMLWLVTLTGLTGCAGSGKPKEKKTVQPGYEVMYHVVQRSFYDSDEDNHGDLKGLTQKLDYLQELGVNAILLLPLHQSDFYHNYFASDFKKIDPEFGNMQDYLDLVSALHQRGMKLYIDMEIQYVTEDHPWYRSSYGKPGSPYSNYIVYNDSANLNPEPIIFDLKELEGYNGVKKKVATVNLQSPEVKEYAYRLFRFWIDPDGNGNFDDGVDGFRIDHMMDDLDWKKKFTGLFADFWSPLMNRLRLINPSVIFMGEQAEWNSWGTEYYEEAGVDRVFAFNLQQAIAAFDKEKIDAMADSTFAMTPNGKNVIVFIENHDMQRFGSRVAGNRDKLKVGAAFNLLIGGVPSIYYGQELGMQGSGGFGKFGNTDGNDIPVREAFEWYRNDSGHGMSLWYKHSGPWWDQRSTKPGDGISLEEEYEDAASLWNFYRHLIRLRNQNPELAVGRYQTIHNDNDSVVTFLRYRQAGGILTAINLSGSSQQVRITLTGSEIKKTKPAIPLMGDARLVDSAGSMPVTLPAYGVQVWRIS